MKTLADMTTQERAQSRGMWCYIFDREGEPPTGEGIIAGYKESDDGRTLAVIDHPHPDAGKWGYELNKVSSRPELPRAWKPNGQPLEADWQYAEYRPGVNRGFYTIQETIEKGPEMAEGTTMARRWIGDWEEA